DLKEANEKTPSSRLQAPERLQASSGKRQAELFEIRSGGLLWTLDIALVLARCRRVVFVATLRANQRRESAFARQPLLVCYRDLALDGKAVGRHAQGGPGAAGFGDERAVAARRYVGGLDVQR